MPRVLLALCVPLLVLNACHQAPPDSAAPETPAPPAWLARWSSNAAPQFVCVSSRVDSAPDFADTTLFSSALLQTYGALEIVHSRWRDAVYGDMPPLEFACARMPDELYAFGLYQAAADGVDQSALRGGPAKRLDEALLVFKGNWVAWTEPQPRHAVPLVGYEELFGKLCAALPGSNWRLPVPVARMAAMSPAPSHIDFKPAAALRTADIGPAVTATFRAPHGEAMLFQAIPQTESHGATCLSKLHTALHTRGVTAAVVRNNGQASLFAASSDDGPLYAVATSNGLCGVRGLAHLGDAQALVARWLDIQ